MGFSGPYGLQFLPCSSIIISISENSQKRKQRPIWNHLCEKVCQSAQRLRRWGQGSCRRVYMAEYAIRKSAFLRVSWSWLARAERGVLGKNPPDIKIMGQTLKRTFQQPGREKYRSAQGNPGKAGWFCLSGQAQ